MSTATPTAATLPSPKPEDRRRGPRDARRCVPHDRYGLQGGELVRCADRARDGRGSRGGRSHRVAGCASRARHVKGTGGPRGDADRYGLGHAGTRVRFRMVVVYRAADQRCCWRGHRDTRCRWRAIRSPPCHRPERLEHQLVGRNTGTRSELTRSPRLPGVELLGVLDTAWCKYRLHHRISRSRLPKPGDRTGDCE